MAQKTFMKIDQVDGESQDLHHKKEIEVLNWTWTMGYVGSSPSALHKGSGRLHPDKSGWHCRFSDIILSLLRRTAFRTCIVAYGDT